MFLKRDLFVTGGVCMLKTGLKDGPNKGKSFYVCVDKQGCDFSQQTRYSHSTVFSDLKQSLSLCLNQIIIS